VGRRLLLALAVATVLALPGQARAAIPLSPCKTAGVQCGTVNVPLDRSGRVGGTVPLHVEVLPAEGLARGVMFLIAGGPGQGSAHAFDLGSSFNRELMRFLFPGYTLVAFDNRGTGDSGLIRCPALQDAPNPTPEEAAALARDCAAIIGPQREFYATRDHADDIESVRTALGFDRIGLYGVSYGTKLAMWYALQHPAAVERILLDSVVVPTFPDPFDRNVLREMPAALRAFCAGGICRGATSDFAGEVVALANRLEERPAQGTVIAPNGRITTLRMNGEDVLRVIIDSDLSPGLAAEAPAAIHAALGGNMRPLLRIFDLDLRTSQLSSEDLSFGLYAATNCADGRFPWSRDTPPAARRAAIDSAVASFLPGALGPFDKWAAKIGTAYFCEQWPTPAGNAPLGPGPLPNVPMLAVNGGFDLRTPTANAATVASQFPQGKLLVVPGVGHSVLSADFSGCSQRAVRGWILGTVDIPTQAICTPRVPPLVKVLGAFPKRPASRSVSSTLALASKAVREAEATWFQLLFASRPITPRGLYGGTLVNKGGDAFTLQRYSIAPGVFVSGKLTLADIGPPSTYKGTVRVSGPAVVAGTLTFSAKNRVTGTLGGRPVKGSY
jgi:pimeloyl-ACP methyl ester carboxylesterase